MHYYLDFFIATKTCIAYKYGCMKVNSLTGEIKNKYFSDNNNKVKSISTYTHTYKYIVVFSFSKTFFRFYYGGKVFVYKKSEDEIIQNRIDFLHDC